MSGAGANATWDFRGQTALISGGARGIGLALSRSFVDAGAAVWILDKDEDELQAAAERIGATPAVVDVCSTPDVERTVEHAVATTGRVDILVNNAGLLRDRVLWKLDDEDWHAVLDVSLGGSFRLMRACVPHFRERRFGRVINVTSYTGLHGNVGQSAYAAAKSGVIGLTKTAAKELAAFGVTVNAISPSARTRMVDAIPEDKKASLLSLVPAGRFAEPDEMAAGVMFLASAEAGYITGAILPINGGISI